MCSNSIFSYQCSLWAEIINNKFPNKSEKYWWKKFVRELDYLSTTQASSGSLVLLKLWADWDRAAALSWNEIWILIRFLYFFLLSFTVDHKIKIKGQASKLLWTLFFHESLSKQDIKVTTVSKKSHPYSILLCRSPSLGDRSWSGVPERILITFFFFCRVLLQSPDLFKLLADVLIAAGQGLVLLSNEDLVQVKLVDFHGPRSLLNSIVRLLPPEDWGLKVLRSGSRKAFLSHHQIWIWICFSNNLKYWEGNAV